MPACFRLLHDQLLHLLLVGLALEKMLPFELRSFCWVNVLPHFSELFRHSRKCNAWKLFSDLRSVPAGEEEEDGRGHLREAGAIVLTGSALAFRMFPFHRCLFHSWRDGCHHGKLH